MLHVFFSCRIAAYWHVSHFLHSRNSGATHTGGQHALKKYHDIRNHNQIRAHFSNSKKRINLSHCFDFEKHIFQRASLFMPPNYQHHYWAQKRQFNSQLSGLHTELLIDAEFMWGRHIHHTHDASLKMSRYCPKALETNLSQCKAPALKMSL